MGQVWSAIKPVKRAAVTRLSPTSWAAERFTNACLGLTPQALCFRLLRRLKAKVLILMSKLNAIGFEEPGLRAEVFVVLALMVFE
jgi:hypothetical protein